MFHEADHKAVLANILKKIFTNQDFAPFLALKGGTCLYFFHGLDRASIDLDFSIVDFNSAFPFGRLVELVKDNVEILDSEEKFYTYYIRGRYEKFRTNLKVEVSKRNEKYDDYEINSFFGIPVRCLDKRSLFSHKLAAIKGRPKLASRDLYDANFMFDKMFPVDERIIKEETGMDLKKYFNELIKYIPKNVSKRGILDELGHLLPEGKKKWAKERLVESLLFHLRSY